MHEQQSIIKAAEVLIEKFRAFADKIEQMSPNKIPGTLQMWESNGVKRLFYNTTYNGKRTRIPIHPEGEGSLSLIEELVLKSILSKGRKITSHNIAALEYFLKEFKVFDPLSLECGYKEEYDPLDIDISKAFMENDICPEVWQKEKYKKNPCYQERLRFATKAGEKVRSKSEAFIHDELTERGVKFRYECELKLVKKDAAGYAVMQRVVYPDFMVLREKDRRVIIHEHFGKMDDPEYSSAAMRKMDDYINAGYLVGRDLFITWETLDTPFTSAGAVSAVEKYI